MDQDGCKLVDLARETNLSLPNASRLVDRLVQRGLVTRLTDPRDRRAIRLHATGEAIEMINAITTKRLEHLGHATQELSVEQIEDCINQLHVLIDAAEKLNSKRQSSQSK
jgi:DNA-binding MarR family transcriptional regulator